MTWRPALVRSLRSFLQACGASLLAFATWLGTQSAWDWVELGRQAEKLALALGLAVTYALVSFIQNFIEDNWAKNIPKG